MPYEGVAHWVAISMFNCKPGKIILMDSLFKGKADMLYEK